MSNKKLHFASIVVLAVLSCGFSTVGATQQSSKDMKVDRQITTDQDTSIYAKPVPQEQSESKQEIPDFPLADDFEDDLEEDEGHYFEREDEPSAEDEGLDKPSLAEVPAGEADTPMLMNAIAVSLPFLDDQENSDKPTPHVRTAPSPALRYMIAKRQLLEKMEALNAATTKLASLVSKKSDLTTQVYSHGEVFGEVLAAQYEKKKVEQTIDRRREASQQTNKPSVIIDELGRIISYIRDNRKDVPVPYNRKISFLVRKEKKDLPVTGDQSWNTLPWFGMTCLGFATLLVIKKTEPSSIG